MKETKVREKKEFQQEIQQLMKTYSMSEEDIAAKLQIRAQTVYRWEKGLSMPKSRIVLQALDEFKKELQIKDK